MSEKGREERDGTAVEISSELDTEGLVLDYVPLRSSISISIIIDYKRGLLIQKYS